MGTTATCRRPGIAEAREAAAADFVARGVNVSADRVLITSGTSEGIELALTGIVDEGEEVLVPSPTYPLYTAVLAKIGAQPAYYRTDHTNHWQPDLDHIRSLINREDARAGGDRSEQPDRRDLSGGDTQGVDRDRRDARAGDSRRRGLRRSCPTTGRCRRWRRSTTTRRSFPTRACRRRISPPAGARAGWRWDRRRVSTARWRRSRNSPTAACAAPGRCSTRSPRRSLATDRTRSRSARRFASAPS